MQSFDVRTKLLGLVGITTLTFLFSNPLYNFALALIILATALISEKQINQIARLMVPLSPVILLIMVTSAFTAPSHFEHHFARTVLLEVVPSHQISVTIGGVLVGCNLVLRLFIMLTASFLITTCTPIDHFIQFMDKLRLPYTFSFALTTAIRFIPALNEKRLHILDAQRVRGARINTKGLVAPIKNAIPIMVPMIINSILLANNMSMSMLNRGFGYTNRRTALTTITCAPKDYAAMGLTIVTVCMGIYWRFGLHRGLI